MPLSPGNLLAEFRRAPGRAFVLAGVAGALAVTPAVFAPGLYDDFTLAKQASLLAAAALIFVGLAWDGEVLPRRAAVRLLLCAWTALLVLSFLAGTDKRGSILGYYQYRQGLLTQVAYIALFLGALKLARDGHLRWLAAAGLSGMGCVTAYTAVQALGRDPFEWWIDTSARAIGTIGNANELAAYAVIALAFCGLARASSSWTARLLTALVAACSSFVVLESESRSGLLALGIAAIAYPIASTMMRHPRRAWSQRWLVLAGGLALGALLSTLAGGATGAASRVQAGLNRTETSGSTRLELWKGAAHTIAASPVWGFGPDGLHIAFPRHRPAGLGGAFLDYDLTAQSSHNAALDIAANEGLPALAALATLLGTVAMGSVRRERGDGESLAIPFIWSAMAGYVALTMVNPVSLAPHALFFILAGVLQGRAEQRLPRRDKQALPAAARLAFVAPAAFGLVAVAILLPAADIHADRAWGRFARGEFQLAAAEYKRANGLLPFERSYAANVAGAWLAAGVDDGAPALRRAVAAYETFDRDFGFTSGEAIGLVTARIGLGAAGGQEQLIARSLELNPHGVSMADYLPQLRLAAAQGGTLRYVPKDHWVKVVPNTAPSTR